MSNYSKEFTVGLLFTIILAGLYLWFMQYQPGAYLKIGIALIIILLGSYTIIRQITAKKRNLQEGVPAEDEFTNQAKLYAGSRAFLYSMYLWLLIFVFHTSFSNQEEMLGIGILGSALIYGIWLWYYKTTGNFHAK